MPLLLIAVLDATLTLSRANSFSVQAKTPNQHRVADIVETLGGGNDLYQAVETLPDGEPASALNQLTERATFQRARCSGHQYYPGP